MSSSGCGGGRDHPRTRGVYDPFSSLSVSTSGSSPHTRGLRDTDRRVRPVEGIIPAHAGFTGEHLPTRHGRADHPRTRGVYPRRAPCVAVRRGSSPHTRGLLLTLGVGGGPGRIIPAHAGFTVRHDRVVAQVADHPRTRGVYSTHLRNAAACLGSSPHTRGLPVETVVEAGEEGIIPAHAGFTPGGRGGRGGAGDHPRTRGVYAMGRARR